MNCLPQEIIDAIARHVKSDVTDVICLALTCTYFFRLLANNMQDAFIEDTAPRAGDRLVFLGEYTQGAPPGILTDEENQAVVLSFWHSTNS